MGLIEKYSKFSLLQLISILESGEDYTEEARKSVRTILEFKTLDDEAIKEAAIEYWEEKINANIKKMLFNNVKPESEFLSFEELKPIMQKAFEKWKETQELLGVDTVKYWFA